MSNSVFEITVLGCSSATPTSNRYPSAQLLNISERYILIDCGEGTQIQLRKYKLKFQRIDHILISHLHGDHYLGLMGLLQSMHLLGRTTELNIYAPAELKEILDIQFKYSQTGLAYKINFNPLSFKGRNLLFEDQIISIESFPLNHRIPCSGFVFKEKPKQRNIIKEKISEYKISLDKFEEIKNGADFTDSNGKIIPNEKITTNPPLSRSYAYCSDTCYDENIIPFISNCNLLYHEATFAQDLIARAKETYHSTAQEAASIAKQANVNQLMIGHYSARYKELDILLTEAKGVFDNTILSQEGMKIKVEA